MNTLSRLALTTLLCSATGNALAASSTDLTVNGLITPSAYTPALSNAGPKDNRGTALDNSDLEKIGDMELRPMSPLADGAAVHSIPSGDRGATWLIWNNLNRGYLYSVSADTNPVPLALKDYSPDLRLRTRIAPASQLTLSNEVNLDGSVTL